MSPKRTEHAERAHYRDLLLTEGGTILLCDLEGAILQVLRDELGLANQALQGTSLPLIVERENLGKMLNFLVELRTNGTAFDWQINVALKEQIMPITFAGAMFDEHLLIFGAKTHNEMLDLYDELMRINNDQTNEFRKLLKDQVDSTVQRAQQETRFYDELTRLYNELANLERAFAKQNSELQQKNEALRKSEATMKALLNAPPDVALLIKPDGTILAANQRVAQTFQMAEDKLIGRCIFDFFSSELAQLRKERIAEVLHSHTLLRYEDQDPESGIMTSNSLYPIFDQDGNVDRIAIFARDVTQRRRAEETLRKSQERISTLINRNADAIIVVDAKGIILFVNPAAEVLFEAPKDQLIGQMFGIPIFDPDVTEIEIPRQFDGTVIVEMRVVEIDWDDHNVYLASLRDITERKRMEADMHQARQLAESASRSKSEFLANMSHELRTPLNGILGYTQILKRDRQLSEQQRRAVDIIHRSGEHLLEMINDILDLSKIEAGKIELVLTDFDLEYSMKSVVEMAEIRAKQKGIAFEYMTSPDVPKMVCGDEKRLRQVLLNLLGNAVKFTQCGQVIFQVKRVQDACFRFEIQDTGIGIPAEKLDDIFQPFQQAEPQQRHVEGTGLGLAISRRIVQLMGSDIHVNSTPGAGSTFWFDLSLPEAFTSQTQPSSKSTTITGFRGPARHVLLVDDKEDNRAVLREILESLGFDVIEAANGYEVIKQMEHQVPDIIFMDIVMPVMDGLDATRRIRENPAWAQQCIIGLSASAFEQTRQKSVEAGCNDFLTKPVQFERLLTLLEQHLQLQWVYDYANSAVPAEEVVEDDCCPAVEDLQRIFEAADIGDLTAVHRLLDELAQHHPEQHLFVTKIRTLARSFQVAEMRDTLSHYLKTQRVETSVLSSYH